MCMLPGNSRLGKGRQRSGWKHPPGKRVRNPTNYQKKRKLIFLPFLGWWFKTHLKNIRQIGNLPQIGVKIKKHSKPPPSSAFFWEEYVSFQEGKTPFFGKPRFSILWFLLSPFRLRNQNYVAEMAVSPVNWKVTLESFYCSLRKLKLSLAMKLPCIYHSQG